MAKSTNKSDGSIFMLLECFYIFTATESLKKMAARLNQASFAATVVWRDEFPDRCEPKIDIEQAKTLFYAYKVGVSRANPQPEDTQALRQLLEFCAGSPFDDLWSVQEARLASDLTDILEDLREFGVTVGG